MGTTALDRPSYDDDLHAWAMDQAARLRALAKTRPSEPIDWELVAEEIEGLGVSDRRACESFIEHVIAHLLEIELAADDRPIEHWRREVGAFRLNYRKRTSASLAARLPLTLDERYRYAREEAIRAMEPSDPAFYERLPRSCPYTWEQVTSDWLPERATTNPAP